ncbi:MAG: cell wall hydrolase [Sphingomonas sp.]
MLRPASLRPYRELALAIAAALLCLGFSAHAALRAIAAHGLRPTVTHALAKSPDADQPAEGEAAPSAGSTGTIALPDLPAPSAAGFDVDDGTVRPARAFAMGAASAIDRARALQCLAETIYYEAASQSDAGQRAVAQVVLNRVMHPAFPDTVCGVVFQGTDRASGCQFSFACDGAMARAPTGPAWDKALRFAAQALAGYVFKPVGLATHYHTYAVTPAWNRDLVMTDAIGAHFFHRWAGWWGTPAAFDQVYRGDEPAPAPRPITATIALAAPAPMTAAPVAAPPPAAGKPVAPTSVQPAYADSGTPRAATAPADTLPQSQILERWKDSGQPLR